MTEMNKLIKLLAKADIPFEVRGIKSVDLDADWKGGKVEYEASIQIVSPSVDNWKIDAICHSGSYGHEAGLIEIMSAYEEDDGVVGWLTAEGAFEYFKKVLQGD